ncbi:hypothetical protein OSG_eHP11_00140 [environmental Halophage eHP-11]|nr:hypothetical protein OSG_eHP11_00140 [environmental Halophage eHP-11]
MTDDYIPQGSEARDVFKRLHQQQAPGEFYALDVDFEFVSKGGTAHNAPAPTIVARVDFKRPNDGLTFTEVVSYNWMLTRGIPVYVVECVDDEFIEKSPENHRFNVYRYKGGDFAKPVNTVLQRVGVELSWGQLVEWERCLRENGPGAFQKRYGYRTLNVDEPSSISAWG